MAEWRVRLAMGLKDEQDQTTFMDLIDGNGRGHRWGMTPATRAAFKEFARGFCGATGINGTAYVKGFASRISSAPNRNRNRNPHPNAHPHPHPHPISHPAGSAARLRTRRGHGASTTCACPM